MFIYLISNDPKSLEYYPDNVLSDFRVQLSRPLELSGAWEIGLKEIQIPYTWIDEKHINIYVKYKIEYLNLSGKVETRDTFIEVTNIHEKKSIDSILEQLNKHISNIQFNRTDDNYIELIVNPEISNIEVKVEVGILLEDEPLHSFRAIISEVEISKNLSDILGFQKQRIFNVFFRPPPIFVGNLRPFLPHYISNISIHCDLVEPQFVSNSLKKILRIIATKEKQDLRVQTEIIDNPMYIPIRQSHFVSIRIQLLDLDDNRIKFEGGVVTVCLDIRKVGQKSVSN